MRQNHVECLAGSDCVRHDMSIFANPAQVHCQKGSSKCHRHHYI